MDEDKDNLSDLLGQLQQNNTFTNKAIKSNENFDLPKEQLEKFILNTSGRLVQDSLDMIDIVKERVAGAAEPDDVTSLSELFKASTSTIETLNKILIQDKKTMTTVAVKQMDIEAKKEIAQQESEGRFVASREEMMKQLVKDSKIIDVTEEKNSN
jgi:hypothetical protein